jgi:hypothetical protein
VIRALSEKLKTTATFKKKETEIKMSDITEKQTIIGPPPILKPRKGEL